MMKGKIILFKLLGNDMTERKRREKRMLLRRRNEFVEDEYLFLIDF